MLWCVEGALKGWAGLGERECFARGNRSKLKTSDQNAL